MIEFKHIHKKYKKIVLNDISFSIEKGECVGILGANGCGKSTLLAIISGLTKADKGEIIYNNTNLLRNKRLLNELIGFVPQYNPLIEELSVRDNLKLWLCANNLSLKNKDVNNIINRFGINEFIDKRVSQLSGGMKRRVSIAIALFSRPELLLLDEPATALDLPAKKEIRNYISDYIKNGGTVIMTTHDMSEISLCTRLLIIKNGKISQLPTAVSQQQLEAML